MKDVVINLLALVGGALVAYGLWLAYQPAGIVAAGAALILLALALRGMNGKSARRSFR